MSRPVSKTTSNKILEYYRIGYWPVSELDIGQCQRQPATKYWNIIEYRVWKYFNMDPCRPLGLPPRPHSGTTYSSSLSCSSKYIINPLPLISPLPEFLFKNIGERRGEGGCRYPSTCFLMPPLNSLNSKILVKKSAPVLYFSDTSAEIFLVPNFSHTEILG